MTPLTCEGCEGVVIYSQAEDALFPRQRIEGMEGLPEQIQRYYDEALRCMSVEAPNGAATMFRKVIHAVGIHYEVVDEESRAGFGSIIEDLEEEGHIQKISEKSLDMVKSLGADGAHVNENEPDMEQVTIMRDLVEGVLGSIKAQQRINRAENRRKESMEE